MILIATSYYSFVIFTHLSGRSKNSELCTEAQACQKQIEDKCQLKAYGGSSDDDDEDEEEEGSDLGNPEYEAPQDAAANVALPLSPLVPPASRVGTKRKASDHHSSAEKALAGKTKSSRPSGAPRAQIGTSIGHIAETLKSTLGPSQSGGGDMMVVMMEMKAQQEADRNRRKIKKLKRTVKKLKKALLTAGVKYADSESSSDTD